MENKMQVAGLFKKAVEAMGKPTYRILTSKWVLLF